MSSLARVLANVGIDGENSVENAYMKTLFAILVSFKCFNFLVMQVT
jgi:hypothetical protein